MGLDTNKPLALVGHTKLLILPPVQKKRPTLTFWLISNNTTKGKYQVQLL